MPKSLSQEEFEERVKEYTNDSIQVIGKYVNKSTKVLVQCKTCNNQWYYSPANLCPSATKKNTFIGCSNCKYIDIICAECGKPIRVLKTKLKEKNYCSRECGNRNKNKDKINLIDGDAYRRNAFLYYPHKCAICEWQEDERVLEVHHLDENRQNNNINNLKILCPICHKFLSLHIYTLEQLEKIRGK